MKILKWTVFSIALLIAGALTIYFGYSSINFEVEEVSFESHGARLAGTIIMPKNTEVFAAAPLVHGSGSAARMIYQIYAKLLASQGVATLVYDKRGVGDSEGVYVDSEAMNASEDNLYLLADDALAAFNVVAQHPRLKYVPTGLLGISQAGWILPLAATKSPAVEFIGLFSGPICAVSEELIYSDYTGGENALESVPSFEVIRLAMEDKFVWDPKWGADINPVDSLETLSTPGFWVFGAQDRSIPVDLSISNLNQLIANGKSNYGYAVISDAGHGGTLSSRGLSKMTAWIRSISDSNENVVH